MTKEIHPMERVPQPDHNQMETELFEFYSSRGVEWVGRLRTVIDSIVDGLLEGLERAVETRARKRAQAEYYEWIDTVKPEDVEVDPESTDEGPAREDTPDISNEDW
jgi:hypothetical protein